MVADCFVLAGDAVNGSLPNESTPLLLLAPSNMDETSARSILRRKSRVVLLLPEIDEDGHSSFWGALAEQNPRDGLICQDLSGVGTQVDWAWNEVVTVIRQLEIVKAASSVTTHQP